MSVSGPSSIVYAWSIRLAFFSILLYHFVLNFTSTTQVQADLNFDSGSPMTDAIDVCNTTEVHLDPNLNNGTVTLYARKTGHRYSECDVIVRHEESTATIFEILQSQSSFAYSSHYVYVDMMMNESSSCNGRFVAFSENWKTSRAAFYLNFRIYIKGSPILHLQSSHRLRPMPSCPKVIDQQDTSNQELSDKEMHDEQLLSYDEVLRCQVIEDFQEYYRALSNITACNFTCPVNSTCGLGQSTITVLYPDGTLHQTLLIYPDAKQIISMFWAERGMGPLETGVFDGLTNLETLWLHRNILGKIHPGLFNELRNLRALYLSYVSLTEIQPGNVFNDLQNLERLYLHVNRLTHLEPDVFHGLNNLDILYLRDNQLTDLPADIFADLSSLSYLTLDRNQLQEIPSEMFNGLEKLKILALSENNLTKLGSTLFQGSLALERINLRSNDLKWINKNAFKGLLNNTQILVDDYGTCCFTESAECFAATTRPAYLTCKRMLSNKGLRVSMWILGFGALFGNLLVLLYWCSRRQNKSIKQVQFLLMVNLNLSDLQMGIYLLILTSVDAYYTDFFPSFAKSWRQSVLCKIAGTLSVLSSQASVFFITLISVERFMGIKYPFSPYRLRERSIKIVLAFLWIVAFLIAVVPTCLPSISPDVYDVSEVCIGLPMSRKLILSSEAYTIQTAHYSHYTMNVEVEKNIGSRPGMYYSIAVFIGLNLSCFLVVAFCYVQIFLAVRSSQQCSGRQQDAEKEIRMAINMSAVVVTDFFCWVPIIIVCILVQCGLIVISPVMYAWTVAFILPINSAVNPFVYSGVTRIMDAKWPSNPFKRQQVKGRDSGKLSRIGVDFSGNSVTDSTQMTELRDRNV